MVAVKRISRCGMPWKPRTEVKAPPSRTAGIASALSTAPSRARRLLEECSRIRDTTSSPLRTTISAPSEATSFSSFSEASR